MDKNNATNGTKMNTFKNVGSNMGFFYTVFMSIFQHKNRFFKF